MDKKIKMTIVSGKDAIKAVETDEGADQLARDIAGALGIKPNADEDNENP